MVREHVEGLVPFGLSNVLGLLRSSPPVLGVEEAAARARTHGWRLVVDRPLEAWAAFARQSDDDDAPETWTSVRSRQRADVREALTKQLGHWATREEEIPILGPEFDGACRRWATGLRLPADLREELEADLPGILAASQIVAADREPTVAFHRALWQVYANGMMPIGFDGRWPTGQLVVARFGENDEG